MKRTLIGCLALIFVIAAFTFRYQLSKNAYQVARVNDTSAKGAFHIHTTDSHDGRQSLESVLNAARDLGLNFVVITDHNVKTWEIEEDRDLWIVRGPELSLEHGHTIRLSEETGEIDIVAHPGRPRKPRTKPITTETGLELVNPTVTAEELVYRSPLKLILSLLTYLAEPRLGLLSLLEVDQRALDYLNSENKLGLWCGVDAHGWIPAHENLAIWTTSLSLSPQALTKETLLNELKSGPTGCFSSLLVNGQPIEFTAKDTNTWELKLKTALPYPGSFRLYRNGELIATSSKDSLRYSPKVEGRYHIEYWVQSNAVPWLSTPQLAAFLPLPLRVVKK